MIEPMGVAATIEVRVATTMGHGGAFVLLQASGAPVYLTTRQAREVGQALIDHAAELEPQAPARPDGG